MAQNQQNQAQGPDINALLGLLQQAAQSPPNQQNQAQNSGPDLGALLNQLQQGLSSQNQQNNGQNSGPDLGALLNQLQQGLSSQNQQNNGQNGGPNLGALLNQLQQNNVSQQGPNLASLLGALGNSQSPQGSSAPPIDMAAIVKVQQAMQLLNRPSPGLDLLRALRPLLSPERAKRVDDAIRIMQLIQLLPAIKESGLLSGLIG